MGRLLGKRSVVGAASGVVGGAWRTLVGGVLGTVVVDCSVPGQWTVEGGARRRWREQ